MIFTGQEFLEWGAWSDSAQVDWAKLTQFPGIRTLYRDLIHLRRNWFNTTRGLSGHNVNVFHVNNTDKVLAFHRRDQGGPGDDVVVLLNCADRAYDTYQIDLPRAGPWRVRFNSDWAGYSAAFTNHSSFDAWSAAGGADGMPFVGNFGLGPYTALILSQD